LKVGDGVSLHADLGVEVRGLFLEPGSSRATLPDVSGDKLGTHAPGVIKPRRRPQRRQSKHFNRNYGLHSFSHPRRSSTEAIGG
jgi:hypothetical protein